jgi:hypothetical protein
LRVEVVAKFVLVVAADRTIVAFDELIVTIGLPESVSQFAYLPEEDILILVGVLGHAVKASLLAVVVLGHSVKLRD